MAYIGKVPSAVPITSADLADSIVTSAKIADGTIALADLSATGTKDATTFLRGDNSFAEAGGGIEVAEIWRLSASFAGDGDVTGTWELADDASSGAVNAGMTQSSGVFTFPQTGMWLVYFTGYGYIYVGDQAVCTLKVSSDSGSTYDDVGQAHFQNASATNTFGGFMNNQKVIIDVTNASTFRFKITNSSFSSPGELGGNTALNLTSLLFLRLGDT